MLQGLQHEFVSDVRRDLWDSWLVGASTECIKSMIDELAGCVAANTLKFTIEKEKLENVTNTMKCKCQSKCSCGKTAIPVLSN